MTLTAILFLVAFGSLAVLGLFRPSWAVAVYMLTFFLAPPFWWWGSALVGIRWNLMGGLLLLGSVLISGGFGDGFRSQKSIRRLILVMVLIALNATFVHFLMAPNATLSVGRYTTLLKTAILFPLIVASIRNEMDVKIILIAIVLGATYIGYEVTLNDRGRVRGNRLEGIGVANASTANDLACLMVSVVPLIAPLFLFGRGREKILAILSGPLILNVLIMCNSRGAFLALIILGIVYVVLAPKSIRPQVLKIACLGLIAGWLLLGDPRIVERFLTTFKETSELDASAASRMDFWRAGLMMIGDHPLGSGGNGFRDVRGAKYIAKVTGNAVARSVHQGYINEACDWGIQGLTLRMGFLFGGLWIAFQTSRKAIRQNQMFLAGVSLSIIGGLTGQLVQSLFGTFLDVEWGLWLVAIAAGCGRLIDSQEPLVDDEFPSEPINCQPE